tara:strand:+ start:1338 stop:1499 length:162 start_codon:yes stop_codon:yes gene_type:complete
MTLSETQKLAAKAKFKLNFALLMATTGRDEESNQCLQEVFTILDTLEREVEVD